VCADLVAHLGERQTEDLKAAWSTHAKVTGR